VKEGIKPKVTHVKGLSKQIKWSLELGTNNAEILRAASVDQEPNQGIRTENWRVPLQLQPKEKVAYVICGLGQWHLRYWL
jgi:hypothetical protein